MPRINLPPGCNGFSDGNQRFLAERGPGSFVNIDDDRQLKKLRNQDYASAGLVDAGPAKNYIEDKKHQGRWCRPCGRLWNAWNGQCPRCGQETVPEVEMERPKVTIENYIP